MDIIYIYILQIFVFVFARSWLWHMKSLVSACGIFLVSACELFVVACGIQFPVQFPDWGLNPGPMNWEHGVLATGPPGKSLEIIFDTLQRIWILFSFSEQFFYFFFFLSKCKETTVPDSLPRGSVDIVLHFNRAVLFYFFF